MYGLTIAGGRGERLRPLTDAVPKAMVPVNDRPLLSYQVQWMHAQGVTDVVFLCGYMGEKIVEYFGDGSEFGVRAHYSHEETPLGRGGAVRKGLSLVPADEPYVLVANGDNVTNERLSRLIEVHEEQNALATLMLVPFQSQVGVVSVDEQCMVREFVEKGDLPYWINAGVYVFSRRMEELLPEVGDHETTTFPALAAEGRLAALKSDALWLTVDGAKDLSECGRAIREGALTFA